MDHFNDIQQPKSSEKSGSKNKFDPEVDGLVMNSNEFSGKNGVFYMV